MKKVTEEIADSCLVTSHAAVQETKCSFDDLQLAPSSLAELIKAIEEGVVSGKIGKQVLPDLLQVSVCHSGIATSNCCNGRMSAQACQQEWVASRETLKSGVQGHGKDGVREYMQKKGLIQISDTGALEKLVDDVLAANPKQLEQYCAGKAKLQGFFVG